MSGGVARTDVIIVGAGITGLTAADAVLREGLSVSVFEARERVGGRARSIVTVKGAIDLGATWFWPNEPLIRSLITELGIPTFRQHLAGDALFESDRPGPQRLEGNPIDAASGRFAGGAQSLAQRLADRLPEGIIRLNELVRAVRVTDEGVRVETGTGQYVAGHVILALPPALAAEQINFDPALPEDVRAAAEATAVWMGQTIKAVAVYDKPFWRARGLSGSAISYHGPFREFHDHSGIDGNPAALFAFASADAFADQDSASVDAAFRDQLMRLFGTEAADIREIHVADWSREPLTTPRRPAAHASTETFGAPALRRPTHDRLHWAATETDTAYAGHLEGAIRSGLEAARRLLMTPAAVHADSSGRR